MKIELPNNCGYDFSIKEESSSETEDTKYEKIIRVAPDLLNKTANYMTFVENTQYDLWSYTLLDFITPEKIINFVQSFEEEF